LTGGALRGSQKSKVKSQKAVNDRSTLPLKQTTNILQLQNFFADILTVFWGDWLELRQGKRILMMGGLGGNNQEASHASNR
jgi:hypothetical protein